MALPGGGTVFAAKIGESLEIEGTEVNVSLPPSFLSFMAEEKELALVVALPRFGQEEEEAVAATAVLDIRELATGRKLEVNGLPEPISFNLPANYSAGMSCMFWDEEKGRWSEEGVKTSAHNSAGQSLQCQTHHLTLFGAVFKGMLKTISCSNFVLFTKDNVYQVFQGSWYMTLGGFIYLQMAGGLVLLFVLAALVDFIRKRKYFWNDGFLLVADVPLPSSPNPAPDYVSRAEALFCGIGGVVLACCSADAVKEALDDICSSWFEHFSLLREGAANILSSATGLLHVPSCSLAGILLVLSKVSDKAAEKLLLANARRRAAASLGMSADLIAFVLENEELAKYLTEGAEQRTAGLFQMTGTQEASRVRNNTAADTSNHTGEQALASEDSLGEVPSRECMNGNSIAFPTEANTCLTGSSTLQASQPRWSWMGLACCTQETRSETQQELTVNADFSQEAPVQAEDPEPEIVQLDHSAGGSLASRATSWRENTDQFAAWLHLRDEVSEAMLFWTRRRHTRRELLIGIGRDLLYHNPIGNVLAIDIDRSAKEKAALLAAELLGACVLVAVYFETAQLVQPKSLGMTADLCNGGDDGHAAMRIGRFLVVAASSLFIAGLPVAVLESLMTRTLTRVNGADGSEAWEKQRNAWRVQAALFWVCATCYIGCCAFYLLVFVASVDPADHWDYTFAGSIGVVQELIAIPIIMAIITPVAARLWLRLHKASDVVHRACVTLHRETNMMLPLEMV